MASIYLVNALYNNKLSVPAAPAVQPATEIKQPAIELHETAATVMQSATATGATPPATQVHRQTQQQSENGGAMHPSRQQMVNVLGPLEEKSEPVIYKVSGANTQVLGHKALPHPAQHSKSAMNKQNSVAPEPTATESIRAARERSFQTIAPSATAVSHLGQHLQTLGGNKIIARRDPRLRKQGEESQRASSSPAPLGTTLFGGYPIKQEESAWESFSEQPESSLTAPATETTTPSQRAESLQLHPMIDRSQLHRPLGPVEARSGVLAVHVEHSRSDAPSESEARIQELENENLSLRKEGFSKDREIRKLKAELLRRGIRSCLAAGPGYEADTKRPRYDEDVRMVDGPLGEK